MNAGKGRRGTVDVPQRMRKMGGVWDESRRVWTVPATKRRSLARLLSDLGYRAQRSGVARWERSGDERRNDDA